MQRLNPPPQRPSDAPARPPAPSDSGSAADANRPPATAAAAAGVTPEMKAHAARLARFGR
jgi:hypothetical protein